MEPLKRFPTNKTMSSYSREPIKKNHENLEGLSHYTFKTEQLGMWGVRFPRFAFSEVIDVAKYECVRIQ